MKEKKCQPPLEKKMFWLPELRSELGFTQAEMASYLGIEISTLTKYEYAMRTPRFTTGQMKKIVKLLKRVNRNISHLPDDGLGHLSPISKKTTDRDKELQIA